MKNLLLTSLLLLQTLTTISQTQVWTKDDRNTLYQEFLSNISSKYRDVSIEQKESIALCAMTTTTEKYTKQDFSSKIEIELKRIYEAQIGVCAKNIGVELTSNTNQNNTPAPVETNKEEVLEWTKQDKEQLSKDISDYASKYPHLNENQREKLELCYINEMTSKFTKKKYTELISIELKQIKENIIIRCASNLNIDLTNKPVVSNSTPSYSKEMLFGTWKFDNNATIVFNENSTFLKTYNEKIYSDRVGAYIQGESTSGDWFIDSKGIITMNEKWVGIEVRTIGKSRLYNYSASGKFKIEEYTKDFLKINLIEGQQCCNKYGEIGRSTFQANRVK